MNWNNFEILFYYAYWIGTVIYGSYQVFNLKQEFNDHFYGYFEDGWFGPSSQKDVSDFEWQSVLTVLKELCPWLIGHIFVSELLRATYMKVLPYWHCLLGAAFITHATGLIGMLLIISQPLCFYLIIKLKSKCCIWIFNLVGLILLNFVLVEIFQTYTLFDFSFSHQHMLMLILSWSNLRCLSFSIDHINSKCKLIELLSYCMYLPTLYLGPFIKFEHIKSSYTVQSKDVGKRSFQLFIQFLRFGFWLLFVEFCLHYFYISAMFYNLDMVQSLNSVALYGYGYCMGQFFHLKYVVFYGLSTSIAAFENIKSPSTPKCIGRIHLYSDMWKYFDVGLYNFLVNYIYFPTVGNFGTFRKLLSSMLCFCYVYIWHGSENYILIWSFYNYLGIIIEQLIKALSTSKYAKKMQDHWRQRLLCAIYSPLLAASAISNFYFFAGTDIGNVFVKRLFQSNARSNLMLLFSLYCCCHVSTHVKKCESKPHKD